jgi:hypothetical protein
MIRTIDTSKLNEPYVNIFELTYLFILTEFHIAMSAVKLYDIDEQKRFARRLFWTFVIGTPSVLTFGVFLMAAVKYLLE